MHVQQGVSLQSYNTFGITVIAETFVAVTTVAELKEALQLDFSSIFILGGGSNLLFTQDVKGLVIHNAIKGIDIVAQNTDDNSILVTAHAGENWHDFVLHCIANNWGGIENLSLIPGNVGTAPIQNIGAYGVELKDVFHSCTVIDRETLEEHTFTREACAFGYRDSIFKREAKGKYVITSVTFQLTLSDHKLQTQYGAIKDTLVANGITTPTIQTVSKAVIQIRQSKLPDPAVIGNSGSFFKNPVVTSSAFKKLRTQFPDIPFYPVGNDQIKVPAGWLIETAGLKGKRFGDAGIHDKQALVLVNHGTATGKAILEVAHHVQEVVKTMFGLELQAEVNII